jgi:hypothetical protein
MLKKIALATITAVVLVTPPALVHAAMNGVHVNGQSINAIRSNGLTLNSILMNSLAHNGASQPSGLTLNPVEPADRVVYLVGEQADGESGSVVTIELPRDRELPKDHIER